MMNRLLSAALLAAGVLLGYLTHPVGVDAQPASFPYGVGDRIVITYADGASRTCVVESFFGTFVSCKAQQRPFSTTSFDRIQRSFVYNLSTSVMVELAARAGEGR
jgi:hypothetical protein